MNRRAFAQMMTAALANPRWLHARETVAKGCAVFFYAVGAGD
jgi:hydroxypyruvate isomerase